MPTLGSFKPRATTSSDFPKAFTYVKIVLPLHLLLLTQWACVSIYLSETESIENQFVIIPMGEEVDEALFIVVRPLTLQKEGDSEGDIPS